MKRKIGNYLNYTLVEGDVNLLNNKEILITREEGLTILRVNKLGNVKTYIVTPLELFKTKKHENSNKENS